MSAPRRPRLTCFVVGEVVKRATSRAGPGQARPATRPQRAMPGAAPGLGPIPWPDRPAGPKAIYSIIQVRSTAPRTRPPGCFKRHSRCSLCALSKLSCARGGRGDGEKEREGENQLRLAALVDDPANSVNSLGPLVIYSYSLFNIIV